MIAAIALGACSGGRRAALGAWFALRPVRVPVLLGPGLPHEDVEFTGHGGVKLRGWLFRPQGVPRGLVVYLHGRDANRAHAGVLAARRFVPRGWAVLAYDQRAHGRSGGEVITYGVLESVDLRAALDRLGFDRVVLIGESMGAATAIEAAAVDARVVTVVAAAPYSDLETILRERASAAGLGSVQDELLSEMERTGGFRIADASPLDAAGQVRVPVLLLHGTKDTFIHPDHSQRLLTKLPAGSRLIRLEGVTHPRVLQHDETWDRIAEWVSGAAAARGTSPGASAPPR